MRPQYHRLVAAVLLPLYLGACTQWTVRPVSPMQVQTIAEDQPAKIRITLADSTRLEFEDITLVGDSIAGRNGRGPDAQWQMVGIDQVALLETVPSSRDPLHALAGVAVIGVAALVVGRGAGDAMGEIECPRCGRH